MVDAVLGLLIENLNTLIQTEFGLIWGVEKDMEKLSSRLSAIRDVLEDAETKHITSKAMSNWLTKLKNASQDANCVLDKWSTQGQQAQSQLTNKTCCKQVSATLLSCLNLKKIMFRRSTGKKIKEFLILFDEIAAERSKFHLSLGILKRVRNDASKETTSTLAKDVRGREGDREKIIDIMLNNVDCNEDNIAILPILGTNSVGKTTLAQMIYNDPSMEAYFKARIWVWVSEDFEIKRLMNSIIEALTGEKCDIKSLDSMQRCIRELLAGKRFLIVLDDVLNQDKEKWNKLKYSLTCGAKGSSVIVTTPLEEVASIMGTLDAYRLEALPGNGS